MDSTTAVLPFGDAAIARAAALIQAGEPVAVPTETVYGLAADAASPRAVAAIYAAKGRPSFNPLIVHVPDVAAAARLAVLTGPALRLAERFWPGPLTIVAPLRADAPVARLATAGLPTVALRVPAHPAMQALLRASGRALAAPSANRSGAISPTRAAHVLRSLDRRVPLVIDGGPSGLGVESTIVAVGGDRLRLLRPGPLAPAMLAAVAGVPFDGQQRDTVEAPGQLSGHYAPAKPVRLCATAPLDGEWLIGFGAISGADTLSARGDLAEAAARLFDCLHAADAADAPRIAVAPVPQEGIGLAINDRLARAAVGAGQAGLHG